MIKIPVVSLGGGINWKEAGGTFWDAEIFVLDQVVVIRVDTQVNFIELYTSKISSFYVLSIILQLVSK